MISSIKNTVELMMQAYFEDFARKIFSWWFPHSSSVTVQYKLYVTPYYKCAAYFDGKRS